jgi:hypothetical protein
MKPDRDVAASVNAQPLASKKGYRAKHLDSAATPGQDLNPWK